MILIYTAHVCFFHRRLHQSEEKFKVHGCITSSKFLVSAGYRVKVLSSCSVILVNITSKAVTISAYAYISPDFNEAFWGKNILVEHDIVYEIQKHIDDMVIY